MSCYAAARAAGYSESYSINAHNRIGGGKIDREIQYEIEKAGATLRFIAEKLVKFAEKDDYRAALPAVKEICELMGLKKSMNIHIDQSKKTLQVSNNTQIQVFNAGQLAEKIKELNGENTAEVARGISDAIGLQTPQATPGT